MAKTAIPRSKAKTAYGLLSEIRRLILEEPLRYNQTWYWSNTNIGGLAPACGTVGCVAGWTCALKGHTPDHANYSAAYILGLSLGDAWELFAENAAGDTRDRLGRATRASLRAHARRGAAHIARFQKKHAKQLKAKKV